jgi:hypothetical protein
MDARLLRGRLMSFLSVKYVMEGRSVPYGSVWYRAGDAHEASIHAASGPNATASAIPSDRDERGGAWPEPLIWSLAAVH